MYPSAQVQVYPLTSSSQVAPLLQGFEAHSFVSINWQMHKWWIYARSAYHYEHYIHIYIVDPVIGKAFAQHSITIGLNGDDDDDIITRTGFTGMLHSGNHWPGYVAIFLTKLNHMAMSNVDIQFNISRKTRLYVINTLGFLFDWVGSYYSFDSQNNGPGDSFGWARSPNECIINNKCYIVRTDYCVTYWKSKYVSRINLKLWLHGMMTS